MIKLLPYSSVAIIGLGRVGRIIAQYLMHNKIYVYAYDDNAKIFTSRENVALTGNHFFKIMSHTHFAFASSRRVQWSIKNQKPKLAIASPGFPDQNDIIRFLKKQQIPIIDEIEFTSLIVKNPAHFDETITKRIIAITGTNGKSTATVLLGQILAAAGQNIFWGGNLAPGLPFATALYQEPKDAYVIEVSSFQLQRCYKFRPQIAIVTNITADHLDRHISISNYQKTKFRIFRAQNKNDYAIINYEDKSSMKLKDTIPSKIIYFSQKRKVNGAYLINNNIFYKETKICSLDNIKLFGRQYLASILAVITASKLLSIKNRHIIDILQKFTGLSHRLKFTRQHAGVKYINNSMCTNPIAAAATLEAFAQPVILIAGGKEKNLDITDYIKAMTHKAKFVVLLGENQNRLSEELKKNNYLHFQKANTLKQAVMTAKKKAVPNDIVLFSPGFASFDKFKNFQERGLAFSEIVYAI